MASLPLVLIAPPGPARTRLLQALPGDPPELFESVAAFSEREGDDSGIVVLGPGLAPDVVLAFLAEQAWKEIPWAALQAGEEEGELVLRPVSAGRPVSPERVLEAQLDPHEKGPLLELHWVLRVIAKARHDLNNPLTSGLAESQLLLMEDHPDEVKESLEVIERQFRRLRDMVADLSRLRVRKPETSFLG